MTKVCRRATAQRFAISLLAFLCAFVTTAWGSPLPPTVAKALEKAGIPLHSVAVEVGEVDSASPLISHNGREAMNPASVMKLLTTYAALEILGPAYVWKTDALVDTAPADGRIEGNLYLRGSGDPRLALEQFWLFLRQLRTRGVTDINGDLVLDRSAFMLPTHDPAAFDSDPLRPYNAGADALLVNLKSLRLTLRADPEHRVVTVLHDTPGTEHRVNNRLTLTQEECGDWRNRLTISVKDDVITLEGPFASGCGEKPLHLSAWPADTQVELLFRALWQELGGTLRGVVREGSTPAHARVLATHESPTLAEIVRETNKYSNNVMARQLFLELDAQRPATPEGAANRIRAWLAGNGLAMPELVLDNGSGLSRRERISAESLARLLHAAWASPVMPELVASLPLAGVDGTLRTRLDNTPASGRAHLKTGYLENVRALAGYVLDNTGKRWIVVFMINHPRSRQGKAAMDALLQWLVEQGTSPDGQRRAAR